MSVSVRVLWPVTLNGPKQPERREEDGYQSQLSDPENHFKNI